MTLHEIVAAAKQRLTAAGIPGNEAALDARLLAQHVLGWDDVRFHTHAAEPPPASFNAPFDRVVERRATREPFAYLVGYREFWNLAFTVSPAVLIPRPETELLVEATLARVSETSSAFEICDVGTGSGCVAVAIAHDRPSARVTATDTSPDALAIALANARRHRVERRVRTIEADLFGELTGPFDVIVSNPPYIPEHDRASLQPEVRDYEPGDALYAGADGLEVIRRLVPAAASRLTRSGWLMIEIGAGQARHVTALISSTAGLTMSELRRDLQGIPRVVIARRS